MAYAFTFWTCYVLMKEYGKIASLRLQFLASEKRRPDQFTVRLNHDTFTLIKFITNKLVTSNCISFSCVLYIRFSLFYSSKLNWVYWVKPLHVEPLGCFKFSWVCRLGLVGFSFLVLSLIGFGGYSSYLWMTCLGNPQALTS